MKTAKTATAKTQGVTYTVPIADLARILTAPRLIAKTATVDYITADKVRITFTDRA